VKETIEEYLRRIQGHLAGQDPLKVMPGTAKKLGRLIEGVAASKLRKRPAPEKWSVGEILAHIADTELVTGWRIRQILASPGTPIQAFDQDAWALTGRYEKRDPRKSLEQFRVIREANLALLKSLTPEQWNQHCIHSERGVVTIEELIRWIAGHDINHIKQVDAILVNAIPVKKFVAKKSNR
jgi:hypothetical protein